MLAKSESGNINANSFIESDGEQEVSLRPWDEIIGVLNEVEATGTELIVHIICIIEKRVAVAIPKEQPETEQYLLNLIGKPITLLKTDKELQPIIIKEYNTGQHPTPKNVGVQNRTHSSVI